MHPSDIIALYSFSGHELQDIAELPMDPLKMLYCKLLPLTAMQLLSLDSKAVIDPPSGRLALSNTFSRIKWSRVCAYLYENMYKTL